MRRGRGFVSVQGKVARAAHVPIRDEQPHLDPVLFQSRSTNLGRRDVCETLVAYDDLPRVVQSLSVPWDPQIIALNWQRNQRIGFEGRKLIRLPVTA